ncbi:MAG TPA: hypothetical protein VGW78_07420 [Candidatus Babeliales bacterium]|nr:hypothetical protein [Candidatus Babeliales bacterium]
MKRIFFVLSVCSLFTYTVPDGTLDTTFGNGAGFIVSGVPGFFVGGMRIQNDGKIVVVGTNPDNVFQTIRVNSNGTLDTKFFNSGIVTGPFGVPFDVILQPNDYILLGGQDNLGNFQLVRYDSAGFSDNNFGFFGVVTGPSGFCSSLALQLDGHIIAAGGDGSGNVRVVRYNNADGSIDIVFSSGPLGYAEDVKIQSDGKVVIAGTDNLGNFQLVRYNTNGTIDTTFGISGIVTGPAGIVTSLLVQKDGKFIAVGSDMSNPNNVQLARYNTDGSLDITFGTNGITVGPQGLANKAVLESDGKIVTAGFNNNQTQLMRFTAAGVLDVAFGTNGVSAPLTGSFDAVAFQSNGAIFVAGVNSNFSQYQLTRYTGSQAITNLDITSLPISSHGTIIFKGSAQNPSSVYLFVDGSLQGSTVTDIGGTNSWLDSVTISSPGQHLIRATSLYDDGKINSGYSQLVRIF